MICPSAIGLRCEVIGRKYVRVDIEPMRDRPFRVESRLRGLPGLGIMTAEMSEFRLARTSELASDGNDDLHLGVNISGAETIVQRGQEVELRAGEATLLSMAETGTIVRTSPGQRLRFQIPLNALAPLVTRVEDAVLRPIPAGTTALRLLRSYLGAVEEDGALAKAASARRKASVLEFLGGGPGGGPRRRRRDRAPRCRCRPAPAGNADRRQAPPG
jgi:hypothetical protein